MLDAFWSGVGEELAKNWVARVLTPALAFWIGGLALVWWHAHAADLATTGWTATIAADAAVLETLPVAVQVAIVIGGLVLVAASAVVAERLTFPLLRILEGYWTRPGWLRRLLVGHRQQRFAAVTARIAPLQSRQRRGSLSVAENRERQRLRAAPRTDPARLADLERRAAPGFTAQERARLAGGVAWLRTTPQDDDLRMPTRLGDILRAAEHRPGVTYGLDAVVCWNALWPQLPPEARTDLTQARSALDAAVRGWLWGALFLLWTPFSWWAVAIGVLVPLVSYRFGILPRAAAFAELVVTAYDLHRMALYTALRLAPPRTVGDERTVTGPLATSILAGILTDQGLRYHHPSPAS